MIQAFSFLPSPYLSYPPFWWQVLASKKGAMRALGRLARHDAAAVEIASNAGLPPLVALLDCDDASLVRRSAHQDTVARTPKVMVIFDISHLYKCSDLIVILYACMVNLANLQRCSVRENEEL